MTRGERLSATLLLFLLARAGVAAPITVTEAGDELHETGCAATGQAPCTLRDAIAYANAHKGKDTIAFAVGSGPARIALASPLPPITDPAVLDGTTQPGFAGVPLVTLDGAGAGEESVGLRLTAGSSAVRGLAVVRFRPKAHGAIVLEEKGGNRLAGNFVGIDPSGAAGMGNGGAGILVRSDGNTIGGTGRGEGNVVSGNAGDGVRLAGAGNLVAGNRIGTDPDGTRAIANRGDGIASSGGNTIGGAAPAARNLVSGNAGTGISAGANDAIVGNFVGTDETGAAAVGNSRGGIRGGGTIGGAEGTRPAGPCSGPCNLVSGNGGAGIAPAEGALVEGNFVGTDVSGTAALPNREAGIAIHRVARVTVGGTNPLGRNLVSGNGGAGIDLAFEAEGARIVGTAIGIDAFGRPLGNGIGILIRDGARGTEIGGGSSVEVNRIAFNSGAGVEVQNSAGGGNTVRGNSIFENGNLGIDFGGDGVTENAAPDAAGPGVHPNFPVLTKVTPYSVEGTIDAAPSTNYSLDFFTNRQCDPSGFGQGETQIAVTTVATDANGHADFGVSLTAPPGQPVTATATDAAGNTSEFSACVPAEDEEPQ